MICVHWLQRQKGLNEQGMSAYCYTGSYQIPVRTLTDSIVKDIMMIQGKSLELEKSRSLIIVLHSRLLRNLHVSLRIRDLVVFFPGKLVL